VSRTSKRAALAVLGVSLLFVVLEIIQNYIRRAAGGEGSDNLPRQIVGFLQPWALFALLVPGIVLFVRRFPRPLALHLLGAVAFAVVHLALLTFIQWIRWPAQRFASSLVRLLGFYLVQDVVVYAAVAATVLVLAARRELRDRELSAAQLQASLAEARLHALRGQIHPHFLFNALNSVAMLVREDRPADALSVLAELGGLLRALLAEAPHEVPLGAELEFNRRYLALERVRFGDRLGVSFECEPGLERALVPHLVLQPLVENAVRHGVARKAGPVAVRVRVFRDGGRLAMEVWNDGPQPIDPAQSDGTGLRTTRGRLVSLYGDQQDLSLRSTANGAVARVSVPLREGTK
jgi:two-component system, LytTR family, sensor kinase